MKFPQTASGQPCLLRAGTDPASTEELRPNSLLGLPITVDLAISSNSGGTLISAEH